MAKKPSFWLCLVVAPISALAQGAGGPTTSQGFCFSPQGVVSLGLVAECSSARIESNIIEPRPTFDSTLSTAPVQKSASGTLQGFAVSGSAAAQSSPGHNSAFATGVGAFNPQFGSNAFTVDSQAYSIWYDTFTVTGSGPFTLLAAWSLDGSFARGPAANDEAVMQFAWNIPASNHALQFHNLPGLNVADGPASLSSNFTLVANGPYSASGAAMFSGVDNASFVMESRLFAATDGTATADFSNTATLDSFEVTGNVTMSDAAGLLHFDGTRYVFGSPTAPVPEPSVLALLLAGLGLVAGRRRLPR